MTYKFPQFQVEIINPEITISMNSISDRALDKLLSVDVFFITDTAKFWVRAENMPYVDTWEDSDITDMVNNWLNQFEI